VFRNLFLKVRRLLAKVGLIKSIEDISKHKDVSINTEMFDKIDLWKQLYKGYAKSFHRIKYQTVEGEKVRTMMSLNMPKVAAQEMASLIYNEKCEINIDNKQVEELVEDVFKRNKFNKKFQDFVEYSMAHGGMVIKPYIEDEKITLSFITADCFIPISWRNDSIYEAVFPYEFKEKDKYYTHLEWHLWENNKYVIKNEVYESSTGEDLGIKVPLKSYFPDLEEKVPIEGIDKPIFSYFKPNTANNIDAKSPLGISIFANSLDTLKAIDTAFDSFHREFRLGKKRIIVPAHMVKTVIDREGRPRRYFDANDETYEALGSGNQDEDKIHDISVELRVDEHIAAINALLNLFSMQTGFSSGTFTFDGQSMKTATEVVSEQSKTFKTKQSHETIIEEGLKELIGSIVAMAQLYEGLGSVDEYEVSVAFDDSIAEDAEGEIDNQTKLVLNGLQSKRRAIVKVLGVTEEEALEILEEIKEEEGKPSDEEIEQDSILFGDRE